MKTKSSVHVVGFVAAVGFAVIVQACGGNSSPSAPSPSPTPSGEVAATITITASGVNPKSVQIKAGQEVRFVNSDTRTHVPSSDPHPTHTECPPLNQVGSVAPGASGTTGPMTTVRTCGFHDHNDPTNSALTGQIVITQ